MSRILYQHAGFPVLQNRVYDSADAARNCATGDIVLVEDRQTGLVSNAAFRPELMVYDANYDNEQGLSPQFRRHLEDVAERITARLGAQNLIEVGCGKGTFLEMLLERGVEVTGFDATYTGHNPRVIKRLFEPGIIRQSATGLILRHVLEHVPNPVDFLFQLKNANGGQGLIYIEVPCFDWICERRAWFDVFYEHVNYFRLSDFTRLFGRIIDSGRFFGDQYLYVVADLSTLREPVFNPADAVAFPDNFLASLSAGASPASQPVCVWGGASKGVIFSLLRQRAGYAVDVVIDVNPAKQGRYLPGTGLLVHSPATGLASLPSGSPIYVMNSNYLEEIKAMSNHQYHYIGIDQ